MQKERTFKIQLFIILSILMFLLFSVIYIIHLNIENSNEEEISGAHLERMAGLVANNIDGSILKTITPGTVELSQEYEAVSNQLASVTKTNYEGGITIERDNVFILKKVDVNFEYVVSGAAKIRPTGQTFNFPVDVYEKAEDVADKGLYRNSGIFVDEDEKSWLMSFAPIYDTLKGKEQSVQNEKPVAILCMRITPEQIDLASAGFSSFLLLFIIAIGASYGVSYYISRIFHNEVRTLAKKIQDIIESGKDLYEIEEVPNNELREIYDILNYMINILSASVVSKNFLDSIIRNLKDTIVVTDNRARIELFSNSLLKVTGYDENELIGQPLSKILVDNPDNPEEFRLPDMMMKFKHFEYDVHYKTKTGDKVSITFSGIPMREDLHGEVIGLVGVARDNTLLRRFILELENSKKNLKAKTQEQAKINRDINNLKRKLEREKKEVDRFKEEKRKISEYFENNVSPHFRDIAETINEVINVKPEKIIDRLPEHHKKISDEIKSLGEFLNELIIMLSEQRR